MKTVAVIPEPQVNAELEIPQEPLDDFSVKPEPIGTMSVGLSQSLYFSISPEAVAV